MYFCTTKSRSGAVVARWAHNPKVVRSNRASATKIITIQKFKECFYKMHSFFLLLSIEIMDQFKKRFDFFTIEK